MNIPRLRRLKASRFSIGLAILALVQLVTFVFAEAPRTDEPIVEQDASGVPTKRDDIVLGIDLGTTFSVVSMYNPSKSSVEIVSYGLGRNTMPSFIKMEVMQEAPPQRILDDMMMSQKKYEKSDYFFYKGIWMKKGMRKLVKPIVGWEALEKTKSEKESVGSYLYRFKPLLARSFAEQKDKKVINDTLNQVKYEIADRRDPATGNRVIGILIRDGTEEIGWTTPRDLSTMVLSTLRDSVNKLLNDNSRKKCVVTVPAYFDDQQKKETRAAASMANLEVLDEGIINEPTSAAIAYAYTCANKGGVKDLAEKEFLVFDWGGGTLDLSYLNYADQTLIVKAHTGNNFSGGENVNDRIYNYFVGQMVKKGHIKSRGALNINATLRLRNMVEELKISLCEEQNDHDRAERELAASENRKPSYANVQDCSVAKKFFISDECGEMELQLSTSVLNDLCDDLFQEIIQLIVNKASAEAEDTDGLLNKISLTSADIKNVLYVGGSSRISGVRRLLMEQFPNADHCFELNADTCVSVGAAYHAAAHENLISADNYVALVDALPMNVGLGLVNNIYEVMAKAGMQVPNTITKIFATTSDAQKSVQIEIGQASTETKKFSNTKIVGRFKLDMPHNNLPKGKKLIEVTFDFGNGGDIEVTAKELGEEKGNEQKIVIKKEATLMDEKEIERMNKQYEETREEEDVWFARCEAGKKLEDFIAEILARKDQLPDGSRKEECTVLANETQVWYNRNIKDKEATLDNAEALELITTKHKDVQSTFDLIMSSTDEATAPKEEEKAPTPEEEFVPREDL
ncbi:heat shock 70kDa protein 1/2/6/8 [Nematocida homosporus]|uniref:heat shock 70kDa protein 1/2/6/8 n=1 Tax=Nematocida homosporus TaxID=1912981 RepID=UPI00221FE7C8|nr:heat shock 70kDa protein 1/2/6/8 [Nematocida homosporus]KAI5184367.1 heat shock 70kDa protein 1/2/6/8 [Nematocida homosporus]